MVLCLDQICENRMIPKLVNDEIIALYQLMIELNPEASYLEAGLSNAQMRAHDFSEPASHKINRLCQSDAQIARAQAYLMEAIKVLKSNTMITKFQGTDLQHLSSEVEWLYLQVSVISNIAQGHKANNRHDILTASAFYKKAQSELMRSTHPDERRHKMIKQLADILFGRRKSIDQDLMPEDDFNPDNSALEEGEVSTEVDPVLLAEMQAKTQEQRVN